MSRYTTSIKDILESFLTQEELYSDLQVNDIIAKTKDNFFNFAFAWYASDNTGLDDFERDFLLRYYNNYIGFETLGMFKTAFNARLNMDMPKYAAIFSAMAKGYDPLINHSMYHKYSHESNESGTNSYSDSGETNVKSDNNYQSIDSDNPQVTFAQNDYASAMTRGENNTTNSSTGSSSHSGEDTKHIERSENTHDYGLTGKTQVEAIAEFERQYINLNKTIIESCRDLFLKVW